ncbi:peroxynitrite isomerase THAP4 isoform X1 [Ixodes scapularis]
MGGCCAPGCRNTTVVGSRGLRMFKLPKCPKRRKEWVEKINRGADWIPPKHAYLCEAHFEESMYLRRIFDGWTRLKTTAVPTIFQHNGRQHKKEAAPCFPKETAILPDEGLTLRLQDTSHEKNNGACRNFTKSILKPVEARPQTFATKVPPGSNASLRSLLRFRKDGDAATQARPQTFANKVPPGSNPSLRSLLRFRKDEDAATQARPQTFATKFPPGSNASLRSLLRLRKNGDAATQTDLPSTMRDKATATSSSLRDTGTDPMDI